MAAHRSCRRCPGRAVVVCTRRPTRPLASRCSPPRLPPQPRRARPPSPSAASRATDGRNADGGKEGWTDTTKKYLLSIE
eukprot:scaffold63471_cov44-Tisochrysis_lutea.AAC.2